MGRVVGPGEHALPWVSGGLEGGALKTCPKCSAANPDSVLACFSCGGPLPAGRRASRSVRSGTPARAGRPTVSRPDPSRQRCARCDAPLVGGAEYCHVCGQHVDDPALCRECGTNLVENADYCHSCGVSRSISSPLRVESRAGNLVPGPTIKSSPVVPQTPRNPRRSGGGSRAPFSGSGGYNSQGQSGTPSRLDTAPTKTGPRMTTPSRESRGGGGSLPLGVVVGFVSLLFLNFIPILGPILGGFIAGVIAGGAGRGLLAGFLAGIGGAVLLAIAITAGSGFFGGLLDMPLLGTLLGGAVGAVAIVMGLYNGFLGLIGGAIGGAVRGQ